MYHSAAYQVNQTLSSTNSAVPAIADNVFKIGSQNGFVLQEDMMLIAAYAGGVGLANPKLRSPKLNQFNPLLITPYLLTEGVTNGHQQALWPYRPFTFRNQEEVTAFSDNTNGAAQQQVVVCDFSNGIDAIPPGEELFLAATATTTAIVNGWTLLTYALTQALPEGIYAMIASEVQSATAIYHRWTFWNQFYRPGHLSTEAFSNQQAYPVQTLQKGLMGQFSNVALPNLEVLCSAADASHNIIARCIKVQ